MREYRQRLVDKTLQQALRRSGAVLVEGPKWCGKTTTAEQAAASIRYLDEPGKLESNQLLAKINPAELLAGSAPLLLDEWQLAPELWDAIRFTVDRRATPGQFILTGSAVPANLEKLHHTGTGRFARIRMRPMSLYESGESSGAVSLAKLFQNSAREDVEAPPNAETAPSVRNSTSGSKVLSDLLRSKSSANSREPRFLASSALTIEDLCQAIIRGGWPQATFLSPADATATARDYFQAVVTQDISRVDEVNRDEARTRRLIRSYARLQGSQAAIATIQADMRAHEAQTMSPDTINNYLEALRRIFVIEDLPAWSPKLRSKTAIRTSDTRYFTDPSIAAAALEATGKDLAGDPQTLGFLFETLAVRDLRAYTEALGGALYHYRDKSGLECDTIAHLDDGRYSLIEIKLGGEDAIETAAATLKKLAGLIDTSKMRAPSFLAVLTGVGEFAYQRADGVYVIPLGTLGC
ncbi:DUF4143 domain-containing protein [Varibaculum cambriense]|uniref:ATP-binding protein n=1 Tax=uncultured Varibaculum sp. TaxID=413896 RepID=UPI001C5F36D4|nr:DUF4143 domain-containing protein [uncultured Varibaculum sp.]WIK88960.1 DUF4143 domain-containing protein [Varibaculum cambriense]